MEKETHTVTETNEFILNETESETTSIVCSEEAEDEEFRIESWLTRKGIFMADPKEKEEVFFERKRKYSYRKYSKMSIGSSKNWGSPKLDPTLSTKADNFSFSGSLMRSSLLNRRRKKTEVGLEVKDETENLTRSSLGGITIRPLKFDADTERKSMPLKKFELKI